MKKHNLEERFLEELEKIHIISVACEKVGLSRQSIYRWMRLDEKFKKKVDEAIGMGIESVSDLAENKIVSAINRGEPWAVKYFLSNRNKNYKAKKPMSEFEQNFVPVGAIIHGTITDEDIRKMRKKKSDDISY